MRGGGDQDLNFGNEATIKVRAEGGNARRAFLTFDLSGIPQSATVLAATLTICPDTAAAGATGRIHELHRVTGPWTELGVTWTNQPAVAAAPTGSEVVLAGLTCLSYSVAGDVQLWVSGNPNYGWRVADADESTTASEVRYASRENTNAMILPRLQLSYQ